ncbi:MAG: hypothetical protein NTV09_03160, partial [Bacteroidetes bacterium]|nr:hypothetical protein [Bacteroidota bacterium]
ILGLNTYISTQAIATQSLVNNFLASKNKNRDESQKKKNVMKCLSKYIDRVSVTLAIRSADKSNNSKDGPWYFSELSRRCC